jgi:CheY-like chemotaxis protein
MTQAEPALKLLVVDDDNLSRSMIQILLSQHGYRVDFAANGVEAIEAIKSHAYDLVFMDLFLPDMDGREVSRQVRAWEAGKTHVPIIALTAYDIPGQPLELLKAGMDDYVFKPYNLRQISRMIHLYTGSARNNPSAILDGEGQDLAEAGGAPVLDYDRALQDLFSNVSDYKVLLEEFIAFLPTRLGRMQENFKAGILKELARECHNLRSISASLGALQLSDLATRLERTSDEGQTASAGLLLQQVEQSIERLKVEAENFLRS